MKLGTAVALVGATMGAEVSRWPHQDPPIGEENCGIQYRDKDADTVNSTCRVTLTNDYQYMYVGQGAFIKGFANEGDKKVYDLVGHEGESEGGIDIVIWWEMPIDSNGMRDNSSCLTDTVSVTCTDNGGPDTAAPYFMETVNDWRRAKDDKINLQIANCKKGVTISLLDRAGSPVRVQNITGQGVSSETDVWGFVYSDTGVFYGTCEDGWDANEEAHHAQLAHFEVTVQAGETGIVDLFTSTVVETE